MVPTPSMSPPDWWVAAACVIGAVAVISIATAIYRSVRMARRGQNPLTLPEDLAYRASRSQAMTASRSKADRLAELDRLHREGAITDAERAAARDRILAE